MTKRKMKRWFTRRRGNAELSAATSLLRVFASPRETACCKRDARAGVQRTLMKSLGVTILMACGGNDPRTTPGALYAPYMIERFTRVSGSTLSIYYALSTWNPYTIVLMRADFTTTPTRGRAVRH